MKGQILYQIVNSMKWYCTEVVDVGTLRPWPVTVFFGSLPIRDVTGWPITGVGDQFSWIRGLEVS